MNLKETLKQVFQSPYSQNQWISALTSIFGSSRVRFKVEPSPEALNQTQKQLANAVERVGEITLESGQELPFFEVELNPKIKVERNRVGINDLVKNLMLRGSTTEGALAVFYYPPEEEKSEWRFSFVSKEAGSEFFNELDQKETKPQRYTYVFGTDEGHKTAIDRFITLSDSGLALDDLFEAFSVQSISDDFFREYQEVYLDFVQFLTGKRLQKRGGQYQEEQVQQPSNFLNLVFGNDEKAARDFCKKLIGRIVFLYFLQKKGWLGASIDNDNWDDGDPDFLKHLFEESGKADDFYNQWLSEVFFNTLNCSRPADAFTMPDGRQVKMPYLNGGLFDDSNEPAYHKVIAFPPWVFEKLFDLLGRYNFTVYEDSPEDHIVAVDPEMLGHIFENLLEDNKEKGTYYTPKEIVHYMCQESLVEYLYTHLSKPSTKAYRRLGSSQTELFGNEGRKGQLAIEEEIQDDEPSLSRESLERFIKYQYLDEQVTNQQQVIEELMDQVKICDPTIGSGAFPMGLLQEIIQAKEALHEWRVEQNLEDRGDFDPVSIKLNLIQFCIYGVDIEQGAIDIARLRFWLSLVVDKKQPQLLPNLDYKIMQGNSLLESYGDIDLNIDNIQHDLIEEGSNQFSTQDKERLQKLVSDFYLPENAKKKPEIKEEIDDIVKGFIEGCIQESQKQFDQKVASKTEELALLNQQGHKQGKLKQKEEKQKADLKKQLDKAAQERNKRQQQADELREMFKKQEFNFFLWHLWFQDVFQQGGFDIVIANPPYVQLQKDDGELAKLFKDKGFKTFASRGDIYCLFYELSFQLLKPQGVSTFITSNKWMRAGYGENLREFLAENTNPKRLIDLGANVFESATVDTNVLIAKNEKVSFNTVDALAVNGKENDNKTSKLESDFEKLKDLDHRPWVVLEPRAMRIKKKVEEQGLPLKDWDVVINYGMKTGLNEAFVVEKATKERLIKEDPKSEEILKPFLRGRDIKKYSPEFQEKWLIYVPWHFPLHKDISIKGSSEEAEIKFREQYPAVYNHLLKYKTKLSKRNQAETGKRYEWYALQRFGAEYWREFEKPKIIYPNMTKYLPFIYDTGSFFTNDKCFILTSNFPAYLTTFFNSKIFKALFRENFPELQGGTRELRKIFFQELPIKPISHDWENYFAEVVEEIQANKAKNRDTQQLEQKVDKLLYEHLELTNEEIDHIESFQL